MEKEQNTTTTTTTEETAAPQQPVSPFVQASDELGRRLIVLYNAKVFPRMGRVFADMLFETGVEAGSYIASLADLNERSVRVDAANKALLKLNQTLYVLNVMKEAGYYTPEQCASMVAYLQGLIKAIKDLLNSIYAQRKKQEANRAASVQQSSTTTVQEVMPAPVAANRQPVVRRVVKKVVRTSSSRQEAPTENVTYADVDGDGFNDPV